MGDTVDEMQVRYIRISPDDWDRLEALVTATEDGAKCLEELDIVIRGRQELEIEGILEKVRRIDKTQKDLLDERKRQKSILIGIGIGLGLNIVTGGATLLTLVQMLSRLAEVVP